MNESQPINKSIIPASNIRELTHIALFVAMLAVSSYIAFPLPFSPVPISAQTLAVSLLALMLTPGQAFKTVAVYLIAGSIGAPVFARGASGLGSLVGPTGGFLFGFLVAAVAMSMLKELGSGEKSFRRYFLVTLTGVPIIYAFGATWMMYSLSMELHKVWMVAVLPFLPGCIFKCVAASLLALSLDRVIKR